MIDSLRLYVRYIAISVRAQLQYRASTVMILLGNLLVTGIEFLGMWALFDRFGHLRGWRLEEVALLYGMANVAFATAEAVARGFDVFSHLIRSGDFDRFLLRPRSTAFQVASRELLLTRFGRLFQGAAVLLWAISALDVTWTAPKLALLVGAILGGACIFSGLFILQATLAFWTIESLEIVNTVTYGGLETTQYPLEIYAKWFRRFFTFVIPLACMNYFPSLAITGHAGAFAVPEWVPWISPLFGFFFLVVCLRVWGFGVRHYRSTGS
ncbi:MAG: ABC transporter permease [Planctomycetota bacterium]|jgi:ABC-2 type transport system permease protein